MLTGEKPEVNPGVRGAAGRARASRTSSRYVAWCCERALERGMLPHTNLGRLLARGAGAAARGDRLAGADARVGATPTWWPTRARRPRTRRCGSRRSAPPASCASRSRAGSWWASARREEDRIEALEALAAVHAEHGHLQEVILQNFVPHRALLRRGAGRDRRRGAAHAARTASRAAAGAGRRRGHARRHARARARVPAADAGRGHPDPAEPVRLVAAARGRGRHRPRRAVGQRRPHLARSTRSRRCTRCASGSRRAAYALTERLCVYPQYMDPDWLEQGVLDVIKVQVLVVHPAPRLGPARGAPDPARPGAGRDRARRATARALARGRAHRAVRRDASRGDRGHAPGGRRAARRAGRATPSRSW